MQELGIELEDLNDWSCCGGSIAASVSHDVGMAMAARNVALAQKQNLDLLASCSGCYNKSARALKALKEPTEKDRIMAIMSEMGIDVSDYNIRIRNVVDVLVNDVDIASRIKITGWDSPVFPTSMDKLAKICGAEVVDFRSKTKCCGGPILVSKQDVAFELTKNLLDEAKSLGADCIVLACPLCDTNLELRQPDIEKKYNVSYNLPIIYITELIGLALGMKPTKLGMNKHIISPKSVLAKLGL
jgi:heterodisulfide reductase subunit B2